MNCSRARARRSRPGSGSSPENAPQGTADSTTQVVSLGSHPRYTADFAALAPDEVSPELLGFLAVKIAEVVRRVENFERQGTRPRRPQTCDLVRHHHRVPHPHRRKVQHPPQARGVPVTARPGTGGPVMTVTQHSPRRSVSTAARPARSRSPGSAPLSRGRS